MLTRRAAFLGMAWALCGCSSTVESAPPPTVEHVLAGDVADCVIMSDASLRCWGAAIGDGGPQRLRPTRVEALEGFEKITLGDVGCIVRGGEVLCWSNLPSVALGRSGGAPEMPGPVKQLGAAVDAACNSEVCCAIEASGSVACWGENDFGQLGVSPTTVHVSRTPREVPGVEGARDLAIGNTSVCALDAQGDVTCWGESECGSLGVPGLAPIVPPTKVSFGAPAVKILNSAINCALSASGELFCRGCMGLGGHADPNQPFAGLKDLLDTSAGTSDLCVVKQGGTVACWGGDDTGQLGAGRPLKLVWSPQDVPGLPPAREVSVASYHACALLEDGRVACWGKTFFGDDKPLSEHDTPTFIEL